MYKNKIIRKIISLSLILLITLISTRTIATTGTVSTETARVRKQASTTSSIVGLVSEGDKVEILEKSGSWYKIQFK